MVDVWTERAMDSLCVSGGDVYVFIDFFLLLAIYACYNVTSVTVFVSEFI